MINAANIPIVIRRNDTSTHRFTLTNIDPETGERTPIDISDWEFLGQAKYSECGLWFTFPIKKTDPINGVIEFSILKADGEILLPVGGGMSETASYEIQATIGTGEAAHSATFIAGSFTVIGDLVEPGRANLVAPAPKR